MTTLTIEDFNNLFKPGQLPDLGFIVDGALSKVTTATLLNIPDTEIKGLGARITAIRAAAISPTLAVAGSPYLDDIKKITDTYATIPTYISNYVKPTGAAVLSAGSKPGLTVPPYSLILGYLKKSIHDFDSILLFELVLQNAAKTDPTTITELTTLIRNYITYLNGIITTFRLDNGTLDKTYYRILANIEKIIIKMDIIVPSSKTIDVSLFVPLVEPYIPPGATEAPRATPGPIILDISKSIAASINALVTQNKLQALNTQEVIKAVNSLPLLITNIAAYVMSGSAKELLIKIGAYTNVEEALRNIHPIPATIATLFGEGLNKKTFVANLTKSPGGIILFITQNYLNNYPLVMKKVVDRGKNSSGQTKINVSSVVNKIFQHYIALLNALINIFGITLTADPAISGQLEVITRILGNTDYKLLLSPVPLTSPIPLPISTPTARSAPSGPSGPSGPRALAGGRRTTRRKGRARGRARPRPRSRVSRR